MSNSLKRYGSKIHDISGNGALTEFAVDLIGAGGYYRLIANIGLSNIVPPGFDCN